MKKRLLSLLCALALCLSLLPGTAWAVDSVSYVEYSWNEGTSTLTSETRSVTDYTTVTSSDTTWTNGWYVVSGSVTNNTNDIILTVSGTVNLILTKGSSLTLSYGRISISDGGTLNIYGQEGGSGTLTLKGGYRNTNSGISLGGSNSALNIHGGTVNATGYASNASNPAPGIDVGTGTLTVYGGSVTATAGTYSNAGRGAGIRVTSGGAVAIHGGTVKATGASNVSTNGYPGAGIGGSGVSGTGETCGTVTITGGTVTANGGGHLQRAAAGIGGGNWKIQFRGRRRQRHHLRRHRHRQRRQLYQRCAGSRHRRSC